MTDENDAYFSKIADYFVFRRGRGVVISSADQHRLREWRERNIHQLEVFEAIDNAFRKSRTAPTTLSAITPFLPAASATEEDELDALLGIETPDADDREQGIQKNRESLGTVIETIRALLGSWTRHPRAPVPVRQAAQNLLREFNSLIETERGLSSDTLAVLDDAFSVEVFSQLDGNQRREVERELIGETKQASDPFDPRAHPRRLRAALEGRLNMPSRLIADAVAESMT